MIYGTRIGTTMEFLFPSVSWSMKWEWWMFLCLTRIKKNVCFNCLMLLKQEVLGKWKSDCKMLCFSHLTLSLTHILCIHGDEIHLCKTLWLCLFNTFPGLSCKNDLWIGLGFSHWNFFGRWQHMRSFYTALITIKSFTDTSLASQDSLFDQVQRKLLVNLPAISVKPPKSCARIFTEEMNFNLFNFSEPTNCNSFLRNISFLFIFSGVKVREPEGFMSALSWLDWTVLICGPICSTGP